MQFTTLFNVAFLAVAVSAAAVPAPAAAPVPVALPALESDIEEAFQAISLKKAKGCHIIKCITALAPGVVACAAALAEEGLNPIADATCLAEAVDDIVNFPADCAGCL